MRLCVTCDKDITGTDRTKCAACIKREQRSKDKVIDTVKEVTSPVKNQDEIYRAVLLPVDVSRKFSEQFKEAIKLSPDATHRSIGGFNQWVIPGRCKQGSCLNPDCQHQPTKEFM